MDIIEFGKQFGPWALLAFLLVKWFIDKGWPAMLKIWNKNQDSEIKAVEDRRQMDAAEQERRARNEERQILAMEAIASLLPVMNARLTNVEAGVQAIRDATTILVERKATVTTTTIPQ